jgi:copine 1/2/3
MSTLCNGDLDRPLKIDVWDAESNGKHDSMGSVKTSVRAMLTGNGQGMDVIEEDKKAKKRSYVNSGQLFATNVLIEHNPTFTEVRCFPHTAPIRFLIP